MRPLDGIAAVPLRVCEAVLSRELGSSQQIRFERVGDDLRLSAPRCGSRNACVDEV